MARQKRTVDQNQVEVATLSKKLDEAETSLTKTQGQVETKQAEELSATTSKLQSDIDGLRSSLQEQSTPTPSPTPLPNASLENSSVTLATGKGLQGGGVVPLGGTLTLSNTGVTKLSGTANQIGVSSATGDATLSLPQDIAVTSTPTFAGLAVSGAVTQGTWNGSAVSPAYGGTGLSHFTAGDLLYSPSIDTLDKLAVGTTGQCLVSLSGKPTWSACATFGPAVTSLSGLTGSLSLANASTSGATITIDNASASAKGIASFNATNFTVSNGSVNTVQNIASSASPSFAGLAVSGGAGIGTSTPSGGGLEISAPTGQVPLRVSTPQGEALRVQADKQVFLASSLVMQQSSGSGPNQFALYNPGGTGAAISNFNGGLALQVFTSNSVTVANGLTVNDYTNPLSPLSVTGGAAFGSYGSSVAAPTNGLIVSGNVGLGTSSPQQKLEVNGGVRLNTTTAKPACDATTRGTFWVTQGASGVKDSVEVCAKDASNAYAYRTLY